MMIDAQKILTNGVVYTVDGLNSIHEAIAIADKKIIAIGTNEEMLKLKTADTEIIDLDGKFVMPSIFDSHCHLPYGAITQTQEIDLIGVIGVDNVLNIIREYVYSHPNNPFYLGLGFARTDFDEIGPRKELLDEICSDKPMWISDSSGHCVWMNSKAFENAGITKNTPDPSGGIFKKHPETGELTGIVLENPAINYAKQNLPKYTVNQYKQAILWVQEYYNSLGITSIYEAGIVLEEPEIYQAFEELAEEGKLTLRIRGGYWICDSKTPQEMDEYLDYTAKLSQNFKTEYYKPNSIKILRDGSIEDQTAYMLKPYLNSENYGEASIDKETFEMMLEKIDNKGMQVHIHQIGDAVAQEALEKFEEIENKNGKRDRRNTFAHCQYLRDDQIDKMGKLGMCATVCGNWAVLSPDVHYDVYMHTLGYERTTNQYKINSLIKAGVTAAFHSDYFVSVPNLGYELYSLLTRQYPKEQFDSYYEGRDYVLSSKKEFPQESHISSPLPPYDEVITLSQSIKFLTYNGAYLNFMEKEIGSLEIGKFADFIVLNKNPFDLISKDLQELSTIKPILTFFDGTLVYSEQY